MAWVQNVILASGTVTAALTIGYMMQSTPVAELRYGPQASRVASSQAIVQTTPDSGPFSGVTTMELTAIAYTSAQSALLPAVSLSPDGAVMRSARSVPTLLAVSDDKLDRVIEVSSVGINSAVALTEAPACEATLTARPLAAAMVDLSLLAPCEPATRVTLHHNGMMITDRTDAEGRLDMQMPALSETAIFMVVFETGVTAMAKTVMTSLDVYDRVVVQWQGPGEMQIHALEYGADYGEDGHVWANVPRDLADAALGKGGFVTQHGRAMPDQDLRAQVYTFPSGTAARSGDVVLSVETQVTEETCGRQMKAQTIQISGGGALSVKDLTLDIPECEATGDFLVLKNLLQDLKIAHN